MKFNQRSHREHRQKSTLAMNPYLALCVSGSPEFWGSPSSLCLCGSSVTAKLDGGKDALHDRPRRGRATGHRNVYGNYVRYAPAARVALAEDTSGTAAVANRHDQLGLGRGIVGALECSFHVARYGAGYEQHIGVARASHEADAQPFEIVVRVVRRVNLQLASVARARINVTDAERAGKPAQHTIFQPLLQHAKVPVGLWSGL